jgi:carbamoyl-phosphate synthase large subunit
MKTIFVSGASGIVGYGTLKSLRASKTKYKLISSTIYEDSVAPAFCDVFELAPMTNDLSYIDWLCGIIKKHKIDMIIPGIDIDMNTWNAHRDKIAERTGVRVMLNNPDLVSLCSDKWEFYQKLQKQGSRYAIKSKPAGSFAELTEAFGLPFLLKPRQGFASKGIVIVGSQDVFEAYASSLGEIVMAQPIVGDKETEYTVSAFFDNHSELCCWMGLRRKLSQQGFTEKAEVANPPHVEKAMKELAKILKPVGPTNFQFRLHKGELKLLEINPRISSATSIRMAFGYNESDMAVKYFLEGIVPTQPKIRSGHAVRYTEDMIFYDSADI